MYKRQNINSVCLFGVDNGNNCVFTRENARISNLSAAFGIERCFVKNNGKFAFVYAFKILVAVKNGKYLSTVSLKFTVSCKFCFGKRGKEGLGSGAPAG